MVASSTSYGVNLHGTPEATSSQMIVALGNLEESYSRQHLQSRIIEAHDIPVYQIQKGLVRISIVLFTPIYVRTENLTVLIVALSSWV